MGQFNPRLLQLAREARGISQSELAQTIKIDQGLLSKYENAVKDIPENHLKRIAEILHFPVGFFMQSLGVGDTGIILHRKHSTLKAGIRRKVEAQALIRMNVLNIMLDDLEIESNLPSFDMEDPQVTPEYVARTVREKWKIPRGPIIKSLFKIAETNGVIILKFDFATSHLDGFWVATQQYPYIALNSRCPSDRQRFTLSHELGHLFMHSYFFKDADAEANSFATEFLMPAADIKEDFRTHKLTLEYFADLKQKWRVSMAALVKRAYTLKFLSDFQYKNLWITLGKLGYRKNEPCPLEVENPETACRVAEIYMEEMDYSIEEVSSITKLYDDDFYDMFIKRTLKLFKSVS